MNIDDGTNRFVLIFELFLLQEFQIANHKKKKHVQLIWKGYSILTKFVNGKETTNKFDLIGNRYPPLWFSRVKSYMSDSSSPLQ